jgi:hypothetical protein
MADHPTSLAGAYVGAPANLSISARDRYILRVRAVAETRSSRPVVSHWSAAAILPFIDAVIVVGRALLIDRFDRLERCWTAPSRRSSP